jgi:pimeloyl-ACP methyl ester carboxylesterase
MTDSRVWDDQVPAFAQRYEVVRFDLRDSGRSDSGTEPFTYVSDMASILRTLHVDSAYLVGIADGAALAVEYAIEYPHQVEALVLVAPTIRGYVPATISPEAQERVAEFFSHLTGATPEEQVQHFIEDFVSLPGYASTAAYPDIRERQRRIVTEYAQRMLAAAIVPGWMERRAHAWLEPPVFQRLSEIHVPTMIVVRGPLTVDAQQYIEALSHAIAGAEVVLIPAESIMINLEQPEAFNRIVLDFLDAINRPPKP